MPAGRSAARAPPSRSWPVSVEPLGRTRSRVSPLTSIAPSKTRNSVRIVSRCGGVCRTAGATVIQAPTASVKPATTCNTMPDYSNRPRRDEPSARFYRTMVVHGGVPHPGRRPIATSCIARCPTRIPPARPRTTTAGSSAAWCASSATRSTASSAIAGITKTTTQDHGWFERLKRRGAADGGRKHRRTASAVAHAPAAPGRPGSSGGSDRRGRAGHRAARAAGRLREAPAVAGHRRRAGPAVGLAHPGARSQRARLLLRLPRGRALLLDARRAAGARPRGVDHASPTTPSPTCGPLVLVDRDERRSRVEAIAARLELADLRRFFDRVAIPGA